MNMFYHYHAVRLLGVGPMGTWLEQPTTGERFLVPSPGPTWRCVGREPIWDDDPCSRCGWRSNVTKVGGIWTQASKNLTATAQPLSAITAKPKHDNGGRGGIMDSPAALQPEHDMWIAFLRLFVEDASGVSPEAHKRCILCHLDDWDCGCQNFKITMPIVPLGGQSSGLTRIRPAIVKKGWPSEPAVIGAIKYIVVKDGVRYYRQLKNTCASSHTVQECAMRWLASPNCIEVCDMLGLEPDHVRRLVLTQDKKEVSDVQDNDSGPSADAGLSAGTASAVL